MPLPDYVLELVDLARNNTLSRRCVHRQSWPSLEPPVLTSFSYTSTLNHKFHLMRVEAKTTDDWDEPRPECLHFAGELNAAFATGIPAPDLGEGPWRPLRQYPNDWPIYHSPWPGEEGFLGPIWWTDPEDLEALALDPDYFHNAYGWPPRAESLAPTD